MQTISGGPLTGLRSSTTVQRTRRCRPSSPQVQVDQRVEPAVKVVVDGPDERAGVAARNDSALTGDVSARQI
jgi:hypothetical protein